MKRFVAAAELPDALRASFSEIVIDRGERLFWEGQLDQRRGRFGERVKARCRGRSVYDVELDWERGEPLPDGWCSCPAFEKFGPCKHLWALILSVASPGATLEEADFGEATWQERLLEVERLALEEHAARPLAPDGSRIRLGFVLDLDEAFGKGQLMLRLQRQRQLRDGSWGKPAAFHPEWGETWNIDDPLDRQILGILQGGEPMAWEVSRYARTQSRAAFAVSDLQLETLLPLLARTGRCGIVGRGGQEEGTLELDAPGGWRLGLTLRRDEASRESRLEGFLERDGERMPVEAPHLVLKSGWMFVGHRAARFGQPELFPWVRVLRRDGAITAPAADENALVSRILKLPELPLLDFPDLEIVEDEVPVPELELAAPDRKRPEDSLRARLWFRYAGGRIGAEDPQRLVGRPSAERITYRNPEAEADAAPRLEAEGLRHVAAARGARDWLVPPARLRSLVETLSAEGWVVSAEGSRLRVPSHAGVQVSSGIDWFDLDVDLAFGDVDADLDGILHALKEGRTHVTLGDGSTGLMPEEWLEAFGLVGETGRRHEGKLRLPRSQSWMLDALVASNTPVDLDAAAAARRERLRDLEGVPSLPERPSFQGTLREYQRDALGWFAFLRDLECGGCLADDMGLGKTVQVLALLEDRRHGGAAGRPSLVVVPKSLLFNWREEARRFTPDLKVLEHHGSDRMRHFEQLKDADLLLTTYGVLRRDAAELASLGFDYVILDEAQAIKNATSQTARAARCLQARHRLALSGTPIENHLGELWSLFEFLDPGMLGSSAFFSRLMKDRSGGLAAGPDRERIAGAIRPLLLRRTKEEVAPELPPKSEQVLTCELGGAERRRYDALRLHYREALLGRGEEGHQEIEVLAALLRLRQAACHPGLIDATHKGESAAKLEVLLPQLMELSERGHKALVFSQFTKMLDIVGDRLEQAGLPFERLDGATRDRQRRVERFQSAEDCPIFLISLKAGGTGLNLTAADYVFLLDPWWNPAVEQQAIDRAHRIGQDKAVLAYRLIARDTVEEKVLELQAAKRELAAAVMGQETGGTPLRDLSAEDLDLLLS